MAQIIIGLGYGDEGKGLTTSFLSSRYPNSVVVRFNGGHQAGHTVEYNSIRHVYSSFNSATLQGASTYWSKYCTFYPIAFLNEYNALKKNVDEIKYYIHALCPVTTLFDLEANQKSEDNKLHGTVGVGFGKTLQRHFDNHYKLYVQDLFVDEILFTKLELIAQYYNLKLKDNDAKIERFVEVVKEIRDKLIVINDDIDEFDLLDSAHENVIFEGAQGVLLDQDFGYFPYVTRSNTTSKNAIEILKNSAIVNEEKTEIYYVTRTYHTRHGNGPFGIKDNTPFPELKNAEKETNKLHQFQGEFKKSFLNLDLVNHALRCDNHFSYNYTKNLVITCVDQTGEDFFVYDSINKLRKINVKDLANLLHCKFNQVYVSYSPDGTKMKLLK